MLMHHSVYRSGAEVSAVVLTARLVALEVTGEDGSLCTNSSMGMSLCALRLLTRIRLTITTCIRPGSSRIRGAWFVPVA